jgi:hypothetical protein
MVDVNCDYDYYEFFYFLKSAYRCTVTNTLNIYSQDSAIVESTNGAHKSEKTNDDVLIFYSDNKTTQYFPKNLDKIFKNLKGILIQNGRLKEIHQSDLEPFPNLVEFYSNFNDIEILEEELFKFNPSLQAISFYHNKIFHIDSKAFNSLNSLKYLWLDDNNCIDKNAKDDLNSVKNIINQTKSMCNSAEYTKLNLKLENIENKTSILSDIDFEEFKRQFVDVENEINKTKFRNFLPISKRISTVEMYFVLVFNLSENKTFQ